MGVCVCVQFKQATVSCDHDHTNSDRHLHQAVQRFLRYFKCTQWRRQRGEASPHLWVDVQKLCNMCVLSSSWNFFVSHDKYIARPSSKEPRCYTDNTTGQRSLRWRKWTPGAVCDMPSCPAVLATLRLSRKPKHQPPQQLPVSACLLFQFLIKMRCSLYWYAVRCPPPTVEKGETHTSLPPLLQNPGGATE